LMIVFGLAEATTGFYHQFLGIYTSQSTIFAYAAVAIGALYVGGGILILTLKWWAARLAILCLLADIAGRIALALTGLYPTTSFKQTVAIGLGTAIAAIFAVYIGSKRKVFT